MSGGSRPLPTRPSLRYLKLEAKRRLTAGEFGTLHDAQVAIAWEHGQPSWAALKQLICGQPESHALAHVRWVIARFSAADQPDWPAPGEHEMREHFDDRLLTEVPANDLAKAIAGLAADLRAVPAVLDRAPQVARVRLGGLEIVATANADPPHRLIALRGFPLGGRITDPRVSAPAPTRTLGEVPAELAETADRAFAELGLAGLVLAGNGPGGRTWVVARGWADLDRAEALAPDHRLPMPGVSVLVAGTAALRLIADGLVGLDTPVNDHLRAVRLADDTITVRELLSHAGGIDDIPAKDLFADRVPELAELMGPVIGCGGVRGTARPNNGHCAVLGQLIADVTGFPYAEAAARLVLRPLGLTDSSLPTRTTDIGPRAITGYGVNEAGSFVAVPSQVCTIPVGGGLWSTVTDVVRLGTGWSSLLPGTLAREALTPQAATERPGVHTGLGWSIGPRSDVAMLTGVSAGTASLLIQIGGNRVRIAMTTRQIPPDLINDHLLRSWSNPTH